MISPEEARKRLEPLRIPGWKESVAAKLDRAGGKVERVGERLLGKWWVEREDTHLTLEAMNAADRERLFETLFPRLTPWLMRAWDLIDRLPYQTSSARRPFRAPRTPGLSIARKYKWLHGVVVCLEGFDPDLEWLAAWAPHTGRNWSLESVGVVLAGAIDDGGVLGDDVLRVLQESASGTHEIGAMGNHVVSGLLCPDRPEAWEFVGNLLLAAQGQEGLRQAIMERADESHPGAFLHLLRLALDNDLLRFSSVVRAADVWLGLDWGAGSQRELERILGRVREFFDDVEARGAAIICDDPADVYYALWTAANEDVEAVIPLAAGVLRSETAEKRFAAATFLSRTRLISADAHLVPLVSDPDLRVASLAVTTLADGRLAKTVGGDAFTTLLENADRFPKKAGNPEPILWPWCRPSVSRAEVAAAMLENVGDRPLGDMEPVRTHLNANGRHKLARKLAELKKLEPGDRAALLAFAVDVGDRVRETALKRLSKETIDAGEARELEATLNRKAAGHRRGVLSLLLGQPARSVLLSADRLIGDKMVLKRMAGLELLRALTERNEEVAAARRRAKGYQAAHPDAPEQERVHLDAILLEADEPPTLDDGLGLYDPADCAEIPPIRKRSVKDRTKAALNSLESLGNLVDDHREASITGENYSHQKIDDVLLGEAKWQFPRIDEKVAPDVDRARLPLADLFLGWEADRESGLRDRDGLELVRAAVLMHMKPRLADAPVAFTVPSIFSRRRIEIKNRAVVEHVIDWLIRLRPPERMADYLLDLAEQNLFQSPIGKKGWSAEESNFDAPLKLADTWRRLLPEHWGPDERVRLWHLQRWVEDNVPPETHLTWRGRYSPGLDNCLDAHRAGVATDANLFRHLFSDRSTHSYSANFPDLGTVSRRGERPEFKRVPKLREVVERIRERLLDVELKRGEAPTEATGAARSLRDVPGIATLVRVLIAMKRGKFRRGWDYGHDRYSVLSHLVRVSRPLPGETTEDFAEAVALAEIGEKRLLELSLYAPQWADHVEKAVGWAGIVDGTWWIHAHTKDDHYSVEKDIRDRWDSAVRERTPLTPEDLERGAVDVAWFKRVYKTLRKSRWLKLLDAAKYASGSGGHKRAQLFADAMLGLAKKTELKSRIEEKRHQDAVRAYGLLRIARGKARDRDVLSRYTLMEEFARTSRKFGSQRQESEKLAVRIGQENLARTAGYADPLRLRWAMEREAVADLADGPVTVEAGDVVVSLTIDEFGLPVISVTKKGKPLKSVPAKAGKVAAVKALKQRKTALKRQRSRIRIAFEEMMIRGDEIEGPELRDLLGHPLIAPLLSSLVLIGDDLIGYPVEEGRALSDHAGKLEPVGDDDRLRIAHPLDLLTRGDWHLWQKDCFARERIQPLKQVFRELYPVTAGERDEDVTRRYSGHQVQPRQAVALLGSRGWVVSPEEGVRKTWHDEGVTALVEFEEYFTTPADVEGLTVERVAFVRRGENKLAKIGELPPRLFSEAMRDLDLMVSVAHMGGVEPEATASTVEMRTSLLRETLGILGIENVRLEKNRALVDGSLGSYSVHLGSAVVHLMPGGTLCIVPVHAQHRGRMFLPFADDDPKTAEVMSKVLLLARDEDIRDPEILNQIRHHG